MKLIPESDFPELQRDPNSGTWYVRKYVKGRGEICKSTREKHSKSRAKTEALRLLSEFLGKPQRGYIPTFDDMAQTVIKLKVGKAKATQESARITFGKHLIPFFGTYRIDQISEIEWESYIIAKRQIQPGIKLFNHWKHMIMVMRLAYKQGAIERPVSLKNPDLQTRIGKVFTEDEINRLLNNANPDLKLQILMGVKMGMRKSEILKLSWDRVDMERQVIHLRAEDTKIRQGRSMGIAPDIYIGLQKRDRSSPWVFPWRENKSKPVAANKSAWRECKLAARVEGRFHDLRHTFLTKALLEKKANPLDVSVYAGVSLEMIQSVYLHPNVEHTRSIANLFWEKKQGAVDIFGEIRGVN